MKPHPCPVCHGDMVVVCECCDAESDCENCDNTGLDPEVYDIPAVVQAIRKLTESGMCVGVHDGKTHVGWRNRDGSEMRFKDHMRTGVAN